MELLLSILFWFSLGLLFYCYLGYGILALVIVFFKKLWNKKATQHTNEIPAVTIIVTAFNEESVLEQKIRNTLELKYPAGLLKIIFITDGSSDRSAEIVKSHNRIKLLHEPERKGKYAAIKRAMRLVDTPVVVFSDANTILNNDSLQRLVRHYADPRIGGVAGEKKILVHKSTSVIGEAEGLYWKYESFMKSLDADLYTVIGAAGELFSIRTTLFRELTDDLILDDFIISMQVCLQGFKIAYEPVAYAAELPSASLLEEEKRKVRISAGAYQSVSYLKECLNIFQHPVLSFQYVSRRLLRWLFCPVMLIFLFLSTAGLCIYYPTSFYISCFILQAGFYFMAFCGWLLVRSSKKAGLFTVPFYFVFMNYCLVKGFFRYMKGRQTVLWEKSLREAV